MMRWLAPFLLLASVFVHWPGPQADFTYDDRDFVETNQSIRSLTTALAAFAAPFPPDQPQRALYRPLTNLSYALDYALWGERARGYHGTNVALYALVVLLVYRLARVYLPSTGFALGVALLFSVHPVHCDAVDSIAGRSEILSLLWSLLSLLLFLRVVRDPAPRLQRPALLGSAAAYALACLSKESGTVLPALLAVHCWVLRAPPRGTGARGWLREVRLVGPHAAVLVLYAALRMASLGQFTPASAILRDSDFWTRFHTMGTVFFLDLRLLILPDVLQVDYYYQALVGLVERANLASLLGWVLLLGFLFLAVRLLRAHFWRQAPDETAADVRERAAALFGLALFFGTLFPYAHVLDIGALMAERFLLAPSLGFLLLIVLWGRRLLRRRLPATAGRVVAALLLASLTAAGAWRSHARAVEWRDARLLWQAAQRNIVGDKRVHANLAAAHLARGELTSARAQIERALKLDPDFVPALGNLGLLQIAEGHLDAATATYRRILELEPSDVLAWYNLGVVAARRQQHSLAVEHYQHALELSPNFAWARRNLQDSERALEEARAFLADQRGTASRRRDPTFLRRYARACRAVGDLACAEAFEKRAGPADGSQRSR
jgi:tetratricopeptide (TPR) repeat protein